MNLCLKSVFIIVICYKIILISSLFVMQIMQFLCLSGQLPLTVLDDLSDQGADHSASMTTVVFSALFNLRLLHHYRSGFHFDASDVMDKNGEQGVWEGEEEKVILNAVKSLLLANTWLKVESQVRICSVY